MALVVGRRFFTAASSESKGFLKLSSRLRPRRTLFASVVSRKDREDMDQLKENPYFGKYADKIAKLQK